MITYLLELRLEFTEPLTPAEKNAVIDQILYRGAYCYTGALSTASLKEESDGS